MTDDLICGGEQHKLHVMQDPRLVRDNNSLKNPLLSTSVSFIESKTTK
jgi:hypothetical protein